jgi:hypothetical protein
MALTMTAGESGKKFDVCPAGTFVARCFQVIDLGTQTSTFLDERTNAPKKARKVRLVWEILDEQAGKREDGKPWALGKEYTASLHEKASLAKDLKAWRGKAIAAGESFALAKLIGQYCQLTVDHYEKDGSTYATVSSIAALHAAIPKPAGVNPGLIFDLDGLDYISVFAELPQWLQKKIEASDEWAGKAKAPAPAPKAATSPATSPAADGPGFDDDVPF